MGVVGALSQAARNGNDWWLTRYKRTRTRLSLAANVERVCKSWLLFLVFLFFFFPFSFTRCAVGCVWPWRSGSGLSGSGAVGPPASDHGPGHIALISAVALRSCALLSLILSFGFLDSGLWLHGF
eukprot:1025646-Rhodomonas_salina.1